MCCEDEDLFWDGNTRICPTCGMEEYIVDIASRFRNKKEESTIDINSFEILASIDAELKSKIMSNFVELINHYESNGQSGHIKGDVKRGILIVIYYHALLKTDHPISSWLAIKQSGITKPKYNKAYGVVMKFYPELRVSRVGIMSFKQSILDTAQLKNWVVNEKLYAEHCFTISSKEVFDNERPLAVCGTLFYHMYLAQGFSLRITEFSTYIQIPCTIIKKLKPILDCYIDHWIPC